MKKRFLIIKLFLILFGLITCILGKCQQLTLEESISLALSNNQQVINGELIILSSEFQIKEAKGALLPKIEINGQYQYYMSVPSQYAPASNFGGLDGVYNKMTFALPQTTSTSIQTSQMLYNQSAIAGLKFTRIVHEASKQQLSLTKEELIYSVSATYYTIQVMHDNLRRIAENISNFERTVLINESLKKMNWYQKMYIADW